MKPPRVGDTVIAYPDGKLTSARSGKIVAVHDDGWTLDVELNPQDGKPNARLERLTHAGPDHFAQVVGKTLRPKHSWDFVV